MFIYLELKKLLPLIALIISFSGFSQHDFYLGLQSDFGSALSPRIGNSILKKKNVSPIFGGSTSFNYRLHDLVSFEAGINQNWMNTRFRDPSFEKENDGFNVNFNNKNFYWSYYGALGTQVRMGKSKNYIYGKFTYSFNNYGSQTITKSKDYIISSEQIDKTFSATSNFYKQNTSFIPELGYQRKIANRHLISFGAKWNMGQSRMMDGTYSITDNYSSEVLVDNFSSLGDYIGLSFRYDILLHHISKKERKKKTKPVKTTTTTPKPTPAPQGTPTTVSGRKIVVTNRIKVHSSKVKVMVWDHQMVDGDRISLNLNGKWILKDYTLEKKKHIIEIDLREGSNKLVLYALNLGKYKPNTAAIVVQEPGKKDQQVILESDMNESGTLEINYKPK